MHRVTIVKDRPDFRVFIDLLFGANRNVDSEGNSNPVNSRTWSGLYLNDRESDAPFVEISGLNENPDIFEVDSASADLEELTALYLFIYSGRAIEADNKLLEESQIELLKEKYTLQLQRAEASIWHRSSNENPYPNLA
jgi:hypothetical protein